METKKATRRHRRYLLTSAYLVISTVASLLFFAAARLKGATTTDISLGVVWVFALSAIVSASLLPPLVERWERRANATGG